jgi:acetyl-CoA C-acetyltransferase
MEDVYIIGSARTPIGKFGGSLKAKRAVELGGIAVKEALARSKVPAESVEEVIMGNVLQAGNGQNPAGQAATLAGLSDYTLKYTVNVVCASGMLAIESAFREIKLGERDIVIAGGMECMSNAPLLLSPEYRWGVKQLLNRDPGLKDAMLSDGLLDAFYFEHMGVSADRTAAKYGITRKAADEFSYESNMRADAAWRSGIFAKECISVGDLKRDEGIRLSDPEVLGRLKPAFGQNGVLTAGNSSQLSDGASALVLASQKYVDDLSLKPLARITGYHQASLDPRDFVEAPIPCTRQFLEKQGKKIGYYDLVEHNEAFSIASIIVRDQLGIDSEKFNVNGGAVAIGHPLGNSGSRIVVTLLNALQTRKLKTGLATICHGGGGAHTMSLELL